MAGLEVFLVTPERELWSGEADMVIARGTEGEVGVLRGHSPMLIRLAVGPLRIQRQESPEERFVVDGGFMHVTTSPEVTRVDVLAEGAQAASEIDVEKARREKEEAERRLAEDREDEEAQARLARANVRLNLVG